MVHPMSPKNLAALLVLVVAGAVLGTIAVRAKEPDYVVPTVEATQAIPIALTGDVPEGFAVRAFDVSGICCPGCGSKLSGALHAVEGVREVAVDTHAGQVSALVRADVDPAVLARALSFGEYSARLR